MKNLTSTAMQRAVRAFAEPLERRVLLAGQYHWPVGAEVHVNSHTTGSQVRPAVAVDAAGNFVVAWEGAGPSADGIYARRFDANGVPQGGEFRVDAPTAIFSGTPTVAMDADGDFVVAWVSADPQAVHDIIYARRYNAAGVPQGDQFRVDETDRGNQFPSVAMNSAGDFVVVWKTFIFNSEIFARRYDSLGAPLGAEFDVSTYTLNNQGNPAVAMDPTGNFVVTWESYLQDGAGTGIYAQRFDTAGVPQGGEFRVNTYTTEWQEHPSVAMDADGDFVIVWHSDYQDGSRGGVYAQRYSASGVPQGGEFPVNTQTIATQWRPSVTMDHDGDFVVVWDHIGYDGIYLSAQRYDAAGVPQGSEFRVGAATTDGRTDAAVAVRANGAQFIAVGTDLGFSGLNPNVVAQRYTTFDVPEAALVGDRVWNDLNSNGIQEAGEPGIAGAVIELYRDDAMPVTSTKTDASGNYRFGLLPTAGAYIRFVTPAGFIPTRQNQGGDDQLDSDADRSTGRVPLTAGAAGSINNSIDAGFVVPASVSGTVFFDRNGDGIRNGGEEGVPGFVVFLDENGNGTLDADEPIGGSGQTGTYTIGSLLGGAYSVTVVDQDLWTIPAPAPLLVPSSATLTQINIPVRTSVSDSSAERVGDPLAVNTFTTGGQGWPRVATDADGDFVVVWEGFKLDGMYEGVYARRYNAAGVPQSDEFRVNTYTTGAQRFPDVAMDAAGNFVVTWMSHGQDGSGSGVYAQRYSAAGVPQGAEFRVNTMTLGDQWYPSVAMDSDGDFVIAWEVDDIGEDVHAQRFDAAGVPQGAEFRANTYTTFPQRSPDVAMDAAGNFIITWMSFAQDGDLEGIYAQRYDADGAALGIEFQVNAFTGGAQLFPSVAMDADGDFVIAWESYGQVGVYVRRYNASGQSQGTEFRVNSPSSNGSRASVATDSGGGFIVTWRSADDFGYGIYAQRYNAAGVPQAEQFLVSPDPTTNQWSGSVAMDADGDFVVAWHEYQTTYGGDGEIRAQRYSVLQRPAIASSDFIWQNAPQRIEFAFDEDVSASLSADDIVIENLTTQTTIPASDIVVTWNSATNMARFTFPALPNGGSLPDGNYRATLLAAGVFNSSGTTIAADWAVEFFFLAGDANHDGRVNLQDFNRLAANFGQSDRDFTQGDFNYDTIVNLRDFNILASRFGVALAPESRAGSESMLRARYFDDYDDLLEMLR